jgi:hypothetical protein
MVDRSQILTVAQRLLDLTYEYSAKDLPSIVDTYLVDLPGGSDWLESRE